MALARKCDRCGKLYEYYPTGNKFSNNAIRRLYKTPDGMVHTQDTSFDLCKECMNAFDMFMIKVYKTEGEKNV